MGCKHNNVADLFEQCAENMSTGQVIGAYYAMLDVGIPSKIRSKFYDVFETYRIFEDEDLRFNPTASRAWRTMAFCFAATMIEFGDFKL